METEKKMPIPLQKGIIYGPVASRRLGLSLGINIIRIPRKICTLDCIYCQYGYNPLQPSQLTAEENFYRVEEISDALGEALSQGIKPEYITLSGNGEATLHPGFPELVREINRLRDRYTPGSRTAILSNATNLNDPHIIRGLAMLDDRIMKLDCGTNDCFQRFNRPGVPVTLDDITEWLGDLSEVTIQSLFAGGAAGNISDPEINAWLERLLRIRPAFVQIYTLARSYPSRDIDPAKPADLEKIMNLVQSHGISARTY